MLFLVLYAALPGDNKNVLTVLYHVIEPLIASPLCGSPLSRDAYFNVRDYRVQMNFSNLVPLMSVGTVDADGGHVTCLLLKVGCC